VLTASPFRCKRHLKVTCSRRRLTDSERGHTEVTSPPTTDLPYTHRTSQGHGGSPTALQGSSGFAPVGR